MIERVAVGTVLLLAGAFKLAQREWPRAAADFGAHRSVIALLPWLELVVGGLLVAQVGGRWTAGVAFLLLAVFTVAVAVRLRLGDQLPCGCFGETSSGPISGATLVRNVVLTVMAAVGVLRSGETSSLSVAAGVVLGLLVVAESRIRARVRR